MNNIISRDKYIELFINSLKKLLTSEEDKEYDDTQFTYLYLNNFGIISLMHVNSDKITYHKNDDELYNMGQNRDYKYGIYYNSDHILISAGDWIALNNNKIKLPSHWGGKEYLIWTREDGINESSLSLIQHDLKQIYETYLYLITKIESIKKESEKQIKLPMRNYNHESVEWHKSLIRECDKIFRFYSVGAPE